MGLGRTIQAFYIDLSVLALYILFVWVVALGLRGTLLQVWCAEFVYGGLLIVLLLSYIHYLRKRRLFASLS
jgi:hypothetical protein